jgi:outer membrane protein assembly factor BamB
MNILTRSYDAFRTGSNREETILTPKNVGSNLLVKTRSLHVDDDPRLEAQPLYVSQIQMSDGNVHDVVYVCTMANNVWAFDANAGQPIWQQPTNLGRPIQPKLTHNPRPTSSEIDLWGINLLWGILSTPVIDLETKKLYAVAWTSPDGTVANGVHELHEVDITSGHKTGRLKITASAPDQVPAGHKAPTFVSSKQKQRAALLLSTVNTGGHATKVLLVGCGMTHEEGDPTHGWLMAFELGPLRATAAWCTSPNGSGTGIWQAGQGPAVDGQGGIYVMTGNYGVEAAGGGTAPPKDGDHPESIVKLDYTPAAGGGKAKLEPVGWFTPFQDSVRNRHGDDDFQDYDLGSAGPVPLPGMNLVVGAGKDGVLYVLDTDTAKFGKGSDFSKLKQSPIFFTYFPGFGIDASNVANLDHLFDGKTHHLHASPVFWVSPGRGPMLFCWGENETLRAWTIDRTGKTTFVAKSAEVASAGMGGKGGMPGGFPIVTSNGGNPDTGIVWATAPISQDANRGVVDGILRAYDATALDPVNNGDGTPRLKLLWDSTHIPGNTFKFSKFCPPVVADGKVLVATYEGRVDIYELPVIAPVGPLSTNANLGPGHRHRHGK